jgi:dTDP-4-dehydrorhamnose 3,5-epimerase-like enzyme
MSFLIESRHLGDVLVIVPQVFIADRGFFMENYRADQFSALGLPSQWRNIRQQELHLQRGRSGVSSLRCQESGSEALCLRKLVLCLS